MSDLDVYEYAVIRVVPSVERGELVNAGVILYCQPRGYLCARIELDEARLLALGGPVDLPGVRLALAAYERACGEEAGPLCGEPLGARFRWLTAPRSTVVQTGPVHAGLTGDPASELDHLLTRLVRPAQAGLNAQNSNAQNRRAQNSNAQNSTDMNVSTSRKPTLR